MNSWFELGQLKYQFMTPMQREQRAIWLGKCTDKADLFCKGCNLLEFQDWL